MGLFKKIQDDMYTAMKAGEKNTSNTLRTTLSKLKDKKIDKRDELSEEEIIKIIQTLVKQRKESIDLFIRGGRNELAELEKNEIDLLTNYLPQMISEEDIKKIVKNVINEVSATSLSDMGKIMPEVMKRGKGLIDGKTVKIDGDKPEQLIERILNASSFKLNWILDPFTRSGGIGVISKKMGRRFIGFESDKDQLLMALKRIDREK